MHISKYPFGHNREDSAVAARALFPPILALFQESSLLADEGIASTGKKRRSRNDIWLQMEAAL
ncbi:MAG: hypothetical protein ACOYYU_15035 [Chloroflexota bacterium]